MLTKHMAACLVATAFAAAPAFAQNSPAPSAPTDRPAAMGSGSTASGSSSMDSSPTSQGGGMQGPFMTEMQTDQMMASNLIGTRVVSANDESIGDVNDVIVGRNGQVLAVVGVGGFLGIGEKDVAVPFGSLEFAGSQQASAMDSKADIATTGSTSSGNNAAGLGSTGTSKPMATGGSAFANEPDRVILRMTKAELQAAPAFRGDADGRSNTVPKQ